MVVCSRYVDEFTWLTFKRWLTFKQWQTVISGMLCVLDLGPEMNKALLPHLK